MLTNGHARKGRSRLALCSRGQDDAGVVAAHLTRDTDVTEALRRLDVVDKRSAEDRDPPVELRREVDHLLHAMNVRGERRHDYTTGGIGEDAFQGAADAALRG